MAGPTIARQSKHGDALVESRHAPGNPELVVRIAGIFGATAERETLLRAADYGYRAEPAPTPDVSNRLGEADGSSQRHGLLPALPRPATPLVGRAEEIDRLSAWMTDPAKQLVTILGPGGMGKTRLALAIAQEQKSASCFPDGVAFADLAPLGDPEQIPAAVAHAVGFPLGSGVETTRTPAQQLLDFLCSCRLLLVMDNVEHLLDGVDFIAALVHDAPQVKLLVTSRIPLRLPAEQLFPLQGLGYGTMPDGTAADDMTAVALFQQAAQRVRPDYDCGGGELTAVVKICRLVEGMPLAIELAASWIATMPTGEILAAIRKSLRFLETDLRNVPACHRSMEAVFDATWTQLDEQTQQMFALCSVFRGGFTREALMVVTGADLRDLRVLTSASLMTYDHALNRYAIHELLRQYGALRLAESPVLEQAAITAHSAFYLDLLENRQDALKLRGMQSDLVQLDAEAENLRRAWRWAVEQKNLAAMAAVMDGLGLYFQWRGLAEEGVAAFAAASREMAQAERIADLARSLAWQTRFAQMLGQTSSVSQLIEQSRAILEMPHLSGVEWRSARALVLMQLGAAAAGQDPLAAQKLYAESLALFRELGEHWFAAEVEMGLAHVCLTQGDFAGQRTHVEAALGIYRALGHVRGTASALSLLADIDSYRGRLISGLNLGLESLAAFRTLEDPIGTATCLSRLGYTYMNLGDVVNARQVINESVAIFVGIGARRDEAIAYVFLCAAELMTGAYQQAHVQSQRALDLATTLDDQLVLGVALGFEGWAALSLGDLARALETLRRAVAMTELTGATMDGARAHAILARAQRENGQDRQARAHCSQALRLCAEVRDPWSLATALSSALLLLADGDDPVRAWELYGMLKHDSLCAASRWFEDAVSPPLAAAAVPAEVVEAALARSAAFDPSETVARLVAEVQALGWSD